MGGVLIDFSHKKMCENIAQLCGIECLDVQRILFEQNLSDAYERGIIDTSTIGQKFHELTKKPFTYEDMLSAISDIFTPKKETVPLLEKLKKQGLSLYLLSNTCKAHFDHIRTYYPFLKFFDGFILSYEINARKPEKKIYEEALRMGKTPLEECFYIDDVLEYVAAAKGYGIDSHHFKETSSLLADLEKRGIRVCL